MTHYKIIDPCNDNTNAIYILEEYIIPTTGFRLMKEQSNIFELCCLYQINKCNYKNNCNLIHVDQSYIAELRTLYKNEFSCCNKHNNNKYYYNKHYLPEYIKVQYNKEIVIYNYHELSYTLYLKYIKNDVVNYKYICNNFINNKCKYKSLCRRLHVCKQKHSYMLKKNQSEFDILEVDLTGMIFTIPKENSMFE